MNGDGKMDLISANTDGNRLLVLTNNGSGGFVLAATLSTGALTLPQTVAAADINGDGKPDLISANSQGNTLVVLTNDGAGGFVLASSPVVGSGPDSVTAADVNGDGRMDLLCANYNSGTVSVLLNPAFNLFGSLDAADLTGTVPDARLSANVALRQAGTISPAHKRLPAAASASAQIKPRRAVCGFTPAGWQSLGNRARITVRPGGIRGRQQQFGICLCLRLWRIPTQDARP